jgi:hypothetical protein
VPKPPQQNRNPTKRWIFQLSVGHTHIACLFRHYCDGVVPAAQRIITKPIEEGKHECGILIPSLSSFRFLAKAEGPRVINCSEGINQSKVKKGLTPLLRH